MHQITILIPGAGIDWAREVFEFKKYGQKFENIGYPYHYYQSFKQCSVLILLYHEFSRQAKELYTLVKDFKPDIFRPGVALQFTESNLEGVFTEEGLNNLFALVLSISLIKKKASSIEDPKAPIFFEEPLEKLVKKTDIREDVSQLLYSAFTSSYVS